MFLVERGPDCTRDGDFRAVVVPDARPLLKRLHHPPAGPRPAVPASPGRPGGARVVGVGAVHRGQEWHVLFVALLSRHPLGLHGLGAGGDGVGEESVLADVDHLVEGDWRHAFGRLVDVAEHHPYLIGAALGELAPPAPEARHTLDPAPYLARRHLGRGALILVGLMRVGLERQRGEVPRMLREEVRVMRFPEEGGGGVERLRHRVLPAAERLEPFGAVFADGCEHLRKVHVRVCPRPRHSPVLPEGRGRRGVGLEGERLHRAVLADLGHVVGDRVRVRPVSVAGVVLDDLRRRVLGWCQLAEIHRPCWVDEAAVAAHGHAREHVIPRHHVHFDLGLLEGCQHARALRLEAIFEDEHSEEGHVLLGRVARHFLRLVPRHGRVVLVGAREGAEALSRQALHLQQEVCGDRRRVAERRHHLGGAFEEDVAASLDVRAPHHRHPLVVGRELEAAHDRDPPARRRLPQRRVVKPLQPHLMIKGGHRHERRGILPREAARGHPELGGHEEGRDDRVVAVLERGFAERPPSRVEHFEVERIAYQLAVNDGEGVAAGEALQKQIRRILDRRDRAQRGPPRHHARAPRRPGGVERRRRHGAEGGGARGAGGGGRGG
mmetsp:Transcript_23606/g.54282  ORF Transcript_23606/g.54282 Transcript_23606/m.54282 type:complete len:608 (+) Transcript_23606:1322-3145(+)